MKYVFLFILLISGTFWLCRCPRKLNVWTSEYDPIVPDIRSTLQILSTVPYSQQVQIETLVTELSSLHENVEKLYIELVSKSKYDYLGISHVLFTAVSLFRVSKVAFDLKTAEIVVFASLIMAGVITTFGKKKDSSKFYNEKACIPNEITSVEEYLTFWKREYARATDYALWLNEVLNGRTETECKILYVDCIMIIITTIL